MPKEPVPADGDPLPCIAVDQITALLAVPQHLVRRGGVGKGYGTETPETVMEDTALLGLSLGFCVMPSLRDLGYRKWSR